MWRTVRWSTVCVITLTCTVGLSAERPSTASYAIVERIAGPPGITGWDYAAIDSIGRRLFLAVNYRSGGGLTVLDLESGRTSSILESHRAAHGIAIFSSGAAAVADAAQSAVLFFDTASGKVTASVNTGKSPQPDGWHNPDSLLLEPRTGLLIAVNKDSGALALVDVARHAVVGTIQVGGTLEAVAAKGDGTVYANIESKGAIAVVDVQGRKVGREIPLKDCEEPTGLEYDSADQLVISVCGNGLAKFVDPATGAELASLKVGKGADAVMYDSQRQVVFVAGGDDAILSVIRVANRHEIRVVQTLNTPPGTRLGVVDPVTGKLYLPAAKPDLKAPPLRLPGLPPLPPAASGTFKFLVVAPKA